MRGPSHRPPAPDRPEGDAEPGTHTPRQGLHSPAAHSSAAIRAYVEIHGSWFTHTTLILPTCHLARARASTPRQGPLAVATPRPRHRTPFSLLRTLSPHAMLSPPPHIMLSWHSTRTAHGTRTDITHMHTAQRREGGWEVSRRQVGAVPRVHAGGGLACGRRSAARCHQPLRPPDDPSNRLAAVTPPRLPHPRGG